MFLSDFKTYCTCFQYSYVAPLNTLMTEVNVSCCGGMTVFSPEHTLSKQSSGVRSLPVANHLAPDTALSFRTLYHL